MTAISTERLSEMREVAQRATPGPWKGKKPNGKYDRSRDHWECQDTRRVNSSYAPITRPKGTLVAFAVSSGVAFTHDAKLDDTAEHIAACDPATVTALIDELLAHRARIEGAVPAVVHERGGSLAMVGQMPSDNTLRVGQRVLILPSADP